MLAHTIRGSGPTVVLVHGVCHRRHAWDAVVPLLAPEFRVVTVDLPGHGESPPITGEGDALGQCITELEETLAEVVPAGERPHLAGNSLGGWAALELGARGWAASVTAISPAGFFRSRADQAYAIGVFRTLRAVVRPLAPVVPALSRSTLGRTVFMSVFCARPWRYPASNMVVDAPALLTNTVVDRGLTADFTFSEPVDEDLPITVLWGRGDLVLPARQARLVPRVFPRARVLTPRGLGHVPMTDDPRLVADTIRTTVRQASRPVG